MSHKSLLQNLVECEFQSWRLFCLTPSQLLFCLFPMESKSEELLDFGRSCQTVYDISTNIKKLITFPVFLLEDEESWKLRLVDDFVKCERTRKARMPGALLIWRLWPLQCYVLPSELLSWALNVVAWSRMRTLFIVFPYTAPSSRDPTSIAKVQNHSSPLRYFEISTYSIPVFLWKNKVWQEDCTVANREKWFRTSAINMIYILVKVGLKGFYRE